MADKIWLKRVLIPLWTLQLLVTVILLGASIVTIAALNNIGNSADVENYSSGVHLVNISGGILIAFTSVTIVFDITEIILVARQKLQPVANIVLQSIKSFIWTIYFLLAVVAIAKYSSGGLSILFAVVLFATCLGQLIYGAVIMHRYRKGTLYRGQYTAAGAVANSYNTGYNAPPFEGAAHAYQGGAHPAYQPYQAYQPAPGQAQYPGQPTYEMSSQLVYK